MIDYYGTKDDYIHAKFGDLRKMYNFTAEFRQEYPRFCEQYERYYMGNLSVFSIPQQILEYVKTHNIPVNFYFNYTDEPATLDEMDEYFKRELATPKNLDDVMVKL